MSMEPQEMFEPAETPPEPPTGWLDVLAGVLFDPRATFARLRHRPPLGLGLAVFAVLHLLNSLVTGRDLAETMSGQMAGSLPGSPLVVDAGALAGPLAVLTFFAAVLAGLTLMGIVHLSAGLLGGEGTGRAFVALAGLAHLPAAFQAPLVLLEGLGVPALWVPQLALEIWRYYLLYRVIRAVHELPRGRAAGALLTPFIMILVLLLAGLPLFGAVLLEALEQMDAFPLR